MQGVSWDVPIVVCVLTAEFLVGFAGGAVYEKVARLASGGSTSVLLTSEGKGANGAQSAEGVRSLRDSTTRMLGIIVGVGGALAVVVQYVLQTQFPPGRWFAVLLTACFCLLVYLMGGSFGRCAEAEPRGPQTRELDDAVVRKRLFCLVAVVVCLFMSFSFFEVVVSDTIDSAFFYQWHRLFLALGYLAIGAAAFFGGRTIASLTIAVAAPFTAFVMSQTAALQVGPFTMALFYALLGAVIAYAGIAFMSLAPRTGAPTLVVSMGRMLEGVATIAGGGIVAFIGGWSTSAVLFAVLALIALTIAIMVRGGFFVSDKDLDADEASHLDKAAEQTQAEAHQAGVHVLPIDTEELHVGAEPRSDNVAQANKEKLPVDAVNLHAAPEESLTDASWASVEGRPAGVEKPTADAMRANAEEQPASASEPPTDVPNVAAIAECYGLTRREKELLGLVLRGLTVQEMADELVITKSTVKYHVTNILKKTGADTRQQLVEQLSGEAE